MRSRGVGDYKALWHRDLSFETDRLPSDEEAAAIARKLFPQLSAVRLRQRRTCVSGSGERVGRRRWQRVWCAWGR